MKKIFSLLFIIVLISLSFCLKYFYLDTKPAKNFSVSSELLKDKVDVKFDQYGIPHINANNEHDAFFALGFVMARDRLWQMEILRRAAAGNLSGIFGDKTLEIDILMRKLQIRRSQEKYLKTKHDKINKEAFDLTLSFIRGINQFIKTEKLPIEFKILNFRPNLWTTLDVLSIGGVVTLSFAEGIIADTLMASLLNDFDKNLIKDLVIKMKNDKVYKNFKAQKNGFAMSETLNQLNSYVDMARPLGLFKGSNSWVLSGEKTKSKKPILSNDPHIGFSNPGFWYEAHIKSPTHEMYGHYLPGVPFAGLGHNSKIAWGITMSEIDDIDLYLEKIDPNAPEHIIYKGTPVKLEKYYERLKIKGKEDMIFYTFVGPHGPIVSDSKYDTVKEKDKFLPAIKWSYLDPNNHLINSFYALNRMTSVKELPQAISHATAPGFNISAVDAEGNIGWHVMGAIPVRPEGISGSFPLEGWHGQHDYIRYLNPMENPHLYNPKKGYIVSANYYPEVDFGINHEGFFQPGERFERLTSIFENKNNWTTEEIKKIFLDDYFQNYEEITKNLLDGIVSENEREKLFIENLQNWNGRCEIKSVGCSNFMYLTRKVVKLAVIDELGPDRYQSFSRVADYWHFFKNLITDPTSLWWNDTSTKDIETKNIIVKKAIKETLSDFEQRFNHLSPTWGELHQLTFEHLLGKVKPLNLMFNRGPYPIDGGYSIVNNLASARGDEEFKVVHGPSTRRIIDFIDPSKSIGILPLGNSGNVFDPNFDSQLGLYLSGKFREQNMNEEDFKVSYQINFEKEK